MLVAKKAWYIDQYLQVLSPIKMRLVFYSDFKGSLAVALRNVP